MSERLHELLSRSARCTPDAPALSAGRSALSYAQLEQAVRGFARCLAGLGVPRNARVAVWLDKRLETVISMFGASHAGTIFVPVNPVLKAGQVLHILRDSGAAVIVTGTERLAQLAGALPRDLPLRHAVVVGAAPEIVAPAPRLRVIGWQDLLCGPQADPARHIDTDITAIFYTSGSTGRPKGVVLSHRNMVAGAHSVAEYLTNTGEDRLLALLPLSFDAGFSQLTTAFHAGASVHLYNYLLPKDVPRTIARERITGLGAVPPVWIPLSHLNWPDDGSIGLRYITNTGGAMPRTTLDLLRGKLPNTRVFLMYGLTEAFRSTYLPPEQLDARPDSMGKAIPNAEVLVVRQDGTECDAGEPGELVHRGALVAQGYWNDAEKTAERFKPAPGQLRELVHPELAVWSGDTVRRDADGFLYFVGRSDDMIKTSGYRVSPTEIEEALYAHPSVAEAAVLGVPDPVLGHRIVAYVSGLPGTDVDTEALTGHCMEHLPRFMVPGHFEVCDALPRNPNGKIDRAKLKTLAGLPAGHPARQPGETLERE